MLQGIDAPGTDDVLVTNDPVAGRPSSVRLGTHTNIVLAYYGQTGASCPSGCAPGRLRTVTDSASGTTTTLTWSGALRKSISQAGSTVSWAYDNDLQVTSETLSMPGRTAPVAFTYDPVGPITCASLGTCADGQAERMKLVRDSATARLSSMTLGASLTETFGYNTYGELQYQSSTPFRVDYEDLVPATDILRDAMGRVKRRKDRVGVGAQTKTFDYTYDDLGRLWKVNGSATSEYRYDANGNRTYAKNTAGTIGAVAGDIVYNSQDQLTKYGSTTFVYGGRGELVQRIEPTGTTFYDYDVAGGLRVVKLPDGRVIEYVIDGFGRRIGKKVNGQVQKQWVYGSGLGPVAELDAAGTVITRFVYASRPNVPDFIKVYATSKLYRVFTDQLGTPRLIYDVAAGTNFKTLDFDEFGLPLGPENNPSFEFPFGFAGGLYDRDTKLTRFGARDYDCSIGRWVSKDPILFGGQQANLYVYVENDPINSSDPRGLLNPLKLGVGAANWARGLSGLVTGMTTFATGTAAAPLLGPVGGVAAYGMGAMKFGGGVGSMLRGAQQIGEGVAEPWSATSLQNLAGVLPSGQHIDDPCEPLPWVYYKEKYDHVVAEPVAGAWQTLHEYFSPTRSSP